MILRLSAAILALTTSLSFAASSDQAVIEENLYLHYLNSLDQYPNLTAAIAESAEDKKILVDAIWDAVILHDRPDIRSAIDHIQLEELNIADRIRLAITQAHPEKAKLEASLVDEIIYKKKRGELDDRAQWTLLAYEDRLIIDGVLRRLLDSLFGKGKTQKKGLPKWRPKTKAELQDLFYNHPNFEDYKDGKYSSGIRMFMFCRKDRRQKCRVILKDKNNKIVMNGSDIIWSNPSLGMSKHMIPYNQRNGHTPSGVYTIDSVMPDTNRQDAFGKFRRMIINFVPNSTNEKWSKAFLPSSAWDRDWWRQASVARDVGRNLLRIHGTGRNPTSSRDPNYPLRPTLGCIMQREGNIGGRVYADQRRILDTVMTHIGLDPVYANETKIHGVLYLIEVDDARRAVTDADIEGWLDI